VVLERKAMGEGTGLKTLLVIEVDKENEKKDGAARLEVYYRRGQTGRFFGRSRNSSRRGKRKYLSF